MEVLDSTDSAPRLRRQLTRRTRLTAVALALVAAGQGLALAEDRSLPDDVGLAALENGYSYATLGEVAVIGFQLRNPGDRSVTVLDVGSDISGLELVDVVVSGGPVDFREAGEGEQPLPAFVMDAGEVAELTLRYAVRSCSAVPVADQPVPFRLRAGRRTGTVGVAIPKAPSESLGAGPDDEDPWQRVLVRDLCPA